MKPLVFNLSLGCDAGGIAVTDLDYYLKNGGTDKNYPDRSDCCTILDIPNGSYQVKFECEGSWIGPVSEIFSLKITSGKMAVGDPCYYFEENWNSFLKKTKYLENFETGKFVSTGGDGSFDIVLTLKKV
jgi:hypothetical protein